MTNKHSIPTVLALALVAFIQVSYSADTIPFPQSVIDAMSTREMRYHHFLWHNVRENWNRFSKSSKQQLKKLGWEPPRPARTFDADGNSEAIPDNNSGEDFLYMHRQMIAKVNTIIAKNKDPYGKIQGWKTIPAPDDLDFPVPEAYNITGNPSLSNWTTKRKTAEFYNTTMKPLEEALTNPEKLRNMTLGELGSRIEVTLHSWMHMRFSSTSPYGYRNKTSENLPYVDKKWDNPSYNWLGDTYGSHVHPLFWKIHGWVDDRIEDWRKANNLSSIKWKGTWTGGPMSKIKSVLKKGSLRGSNSNAAADDDDGTMDQVFQAFMNEGNEVSFGDNVQIDLSFLSN